MHSSFQIFFFIFLAFSLSTVNSSGISRINALARSTPPTLDQQPISSNQCDTLKSLPAKRIAIIGAGSAGSSTAYFLREYLGQCANLQIDVFERNDYIGGRTTTVNVYGDPKQPIELGGSIFISKNYNIVNAAKKFNLSTGDDTDSSSKSSKRAEAQAIDTGVWDGSKFLFTVPNGESIWKTVAKLWLKYGLQALWQTKTVTSNTINNFLKMYEAPIFPWTTLTDAVREAGLDAATSTSGANYLSAQGISPQLSSDLIQALTRVNYAQNLGQIHGVETMVTVAAALESGMAIEGGNWQIFSNMLKNSGANVHLNTTVTEILEDCENGKPGHRRFKVRWHDDQNGLFEEPYDDVVLAAPFQYSNISLYQGARVPAKVDYVELHVTLFATPYTLSPEYFGGDVAPLAVLTTLPNSTFSAENNVGATPFFSCSLTQSATNPQSMQPEYVYKIFSPEPISDSLLTSLLLPSSTGPTSNLTAADGLISWKHEKVWHSYPYGNSRVAFEEFVLDDGFWYTSGIETFISTMETSSLSGKNVAANMVKSWGFPYNATNVAGSEL